MFGQAKSTILGNTQVLGFEQFNLQVQLT